MDFQQVVRRRRMIRSFTDRPIDTATVDRILSNAQRGPSAGFAQGWAFLALQDAADRELFWTTATTSPMPSVLPAPLIVIAMSHANAYLDRYAQPDKPWADLDESHWPVPYWHIDTGMAVLLMLLTAVDAGLDACFIGIAKDLILPVRKGFGVPEEYTPIGAVVVGYRSGDTPAQPAAWAAKRRSAVSVVHHGRWSAG